MAALRTDPNLGYHLFRTYDWPQDSKLLDGPSKPREYLISHAFAATGAAKYFTPPWKDEKGKAKFLDIQYPSPHNITELALNEMWGLYGVDVEISVVVNIGPGTPNALDCRNIARRFSWGRKIPTSPTPPKRALSPGTRHINTSLKRARHKPVGAISAEQPMTSFHRVKFEKNQQVLSFRFQ